MSVKYHNFTSRFLLISSSCSQIFPQVDFMYSDKNLNQVYKLLKNGEDPNYKCKGKFTPFQSAIAICEDNVSVIREFIQEGADVHSPDSYLGLTPLHIAVKCGKLRVTNALINAGAAINAKDALGKTPLHYAVLRFYFRSNPIIIQRLLDCEDMDCDIRDSNGDTALMLAVKANQFGSVVMLLHNRANPNISNEELLTPLHVALKKFNFGIENELLFHGACIFTKNKNGYTPIDILLMHPEFGFRTHTVDLLVKVKIVVFRYCLSQNMKNKFLKCVPELSEFFDKCSEEADRMRSDYISCSVTVHDFVSNRMTGDISNNCNFQYDYLLLLRLIKDKYPEYFYDILKIIPRSSLFSMLEKLSIPKNLIVLSLVSNFLSDIDIFRLILAFSNVKSMESMINLEVREICDMHESW